MLNAASARANQVTVQDTGFDLGVEIANISVAGFYTEPAYAGINHLKVDGTMMNGFCIDPYHFSSDSLLTYEVASLAGAPKPPGTMDSAQATEICKLWGEYYKADMTLYNAAGLQVAIWEVVAGNQFQVTGDDYGANNMIKSLGTYTGDSADLVALTGSGQYYVVQRTTALRVPDQGSTLLLLGIASMGLLTVGAKRDKSSCSISGC